MFCFSNLYARCSLSDTFPNTDTQPHITPLYIQYNTNIKPLNNTDTYIKKSFSVPIRSPKTFSSCIIQKAPKTNPEGQKYHLKTPLNLSAQQSPSLMGGPLCRSNYLSL